MKINKIISGVFSLLILSSFIGCTEIEDHPDGRTVTAICLPRTVKRILI